MADELCPVQWAGQLAVVTLPEQIDGSTAGQIREQLLAALDRGAALLIADLATTISCDYPGAEVLVLAHQRAVAVGADLRLVVGADAVRRMLGFSGLDRLVPIYPTLDAAVAAIPGGLSGQPGGALKLLDLVVGNIFTAGISLQAAIDQPGDTAADRITEAIRILDEVVRNVRNHVFAARGQDTGHGRASGPRPDLRERGELAASQAAFRERMAPLQERMTQTAYSLHFAAAETAVLLEQRAQLLEQPRRIDYPAEIKRWRSFADLAKEMAERWEHL